MSVTATAGGAPLAPPQTVQFADGTANFMYLIGSEAEGTLGWAVVQVGNLQTAPAMIQTGDGSTDRPARATATARPCRSSPRRPSWRRAGAGLTLRRRHLATSR